MLPWLKRNGVSGEVPELGAIFMSNSTTKKECFRKRLFGLPASAANFVKQVKAGMVLFLFEYERRVLYGVYQACSDGGMELSPNAYKSTSNGFPAQVRFKIIWLCRPLSENEFRSAIKDNYFTANKFNFGLSKDQVRKLLWLFSSRKLRDQLPQKHISRIKGPTTSAFKDGVFESEDFMEDRLMVQDAHDPVIYTELAYTSPRSRCADDNNCLMNASRETVTQLKSGRPVVPLIGEVDGGGPSMDDLTWLSAANIEIPRTGSDSVYEVSDNIDRRFLLENTSNPLFRTEYPKASIMGGRRIVDHRSDDFPPVSSADVAQQVLTSEAAPTAREIAGGGRLLVYDAEYDARNVPHADGLMDPSRYPHYMLPRIQSERGLLGADAAEGRCVLDEGGQCVVRDMSLRRDMHSALSFDNSQVKMNVIHDNYQDHMDDVDNLQQSGRLIVNQKGCRYPQEGFCCDSSALGIDDSMGCCPPRKPSIVQRSPRTKVCDSHEFSYMDSDDIGLYDHEARSHIVRAQGVDDSQSLAHVDSLLPGRPLSAIRSQFPPLQEANSDGFLYKAPGFRQSDVPQARPLGLVSHSMDKEAIAGYFEDNERGLHKSNDLESALSLIPPLVREIPVHAKKGQGVHGGQPVHGMSLIQRMPLPNDMCPVNESNHYHCTGSQIKEGATDDEFSKQGFALKSPAQGHQSQLFHSAVFDRLERTSVFARLSYTHDREQDVSQATPGDRGIGKIVDEVMEMLTDHHERVKRAKLNPSETRDGNMFRFEKSQQSRESKFQPRKFQSPRPIARKLNRVDTTEHTSHTQLRKRAGLVKVNSPSDVSDIHGEAKAVVEVSRRELPLNKQQRKRKRLVRPNFNFDETVVEREVKVGLTSASQITGVDSEDTEAVHVKEQHQCIDAAEPEVSSVTAVEPMDNAQHEIVISEMVDCVEGGEGLPNCDGIGPKEHHPSMDATKPEVPTVSAIETMDHTQLEVVTCETVPNFDSLGQKEHHQSIDATKPEVTVVPTIEPMDHTQHEILTCVTVPSDDGGERLCDCNNTGLPPSTDENDNEENQAVVSIDFAVTLPKVIDDADLELKDFSDTNGCDIDERKNAVSGDMLDGSPKLPDYGDDAKGSLAPCTDEFDFQKKVVVSNDFILEPPKAIDGADCVLKDFSGTDGCDNDKKENVVSMDMLGGMTKLTDCTVDAGAADTPSLSITNETS